MKVALTTTIIAVYVMCSTWLAYVMYRLMDSTDYSIELTRIHKIVPTYVFAVPIYFTLVYLLGIFDSL